MKTRPLILLLSLIAVPILLLAGRALTKKGGPLPPTGFDQPPRVPAPMPFPSPASPWESVSVKELETALEDRDDAADILHFLRSRHETIETPLPARQPLPPALPASVRAEPSPVRQEPTIREVQLAAIRYAEVMPEKISRWRMLAQLRNFIPRFTLGLDRDRDTTIASSSSNGKTTFAVGPEDETLSVDFGFTWDLGNLVWDSAQTSIDSRSRLMVQLREETLKETTRLYFERRRLQAEFAAVPTDDPTLQRERSLRLEELTAQLDALTGGLYSAENH